MKKSYTSSNADVHFRAPWLANGARGFVDSSGVYHCTGSQMGRRDCIPSDVETVKIVIVEPVPSLDYAYDKGGAYWGSVKGSASLGRLFCAWGDSDTEQAEVFFRAKNLRDAKRQAKAAFPRADIINRFNR